jgi:hypothetical protein
MDEGAAREIIKEHFGVVGIMEFRDSRGVRERTISTGRGNRRAGEPSG